MVILNRYYIYKWRGREKIKRGGGWGSHEYVDLNKVKVGDIINIDVTNKLIQSEIKKILNSIRFNEEVDHNGTPDYLFHLYQLAEFSQLLFNGQIQVEAIYNSILTVKIIYKKDDDQFKCKFGNEIKSCEFDIHQRYTKPYIAFMGEHFKLYSPGVSGPPDSSGGKKQTTRKKKRKHTRK